jgi:hypothetical protein
MNNAITIQAQVTVYNKTYTISFDNAKGLDLWTKEAGFPEAYGGRKSFVELTTTRDAEFFGIIDCVKA